MQEKLIARAKELLAEGKVQKVVGWRKGLFDYDVTPSVFTSAEDLEQNFVFNEFCGANLSKYLVKITREIEIKKSTTRMNNTMAKQRDPNAQDAPIPSEVALVFLKPNDTYSFTQLLKENRITRDDVYAIGVPCQDTLKGAEPCGNCAVSIIPGIELLAPERQLTRSGFSLSPNFIPMISSVFLRASATSALRASL